MHGTLVAARALTSSTRFGVRGPGRYTQAYRGARVAVRAGEPVEIVADTFGAAAISATSLVFTPKVSTMATTKKATG